MPVPKPSDICLSIRSVRADAPASEHKSWNAARCIIEQSRPTRIEWSYVREREQIAEMKQHAGVFVAALNSVKPPGHARDFEGNPCVAPWMRKFSSPRERRTYICMNNTEDLESRKVQALELIDEGITDTFQFDDWYANAQMMRWPKTPYTPTACFCEDCMREFARYLGLEIDYKEYLRRRGIHSNGELFERAARGDVPLWEDFRRFADETVRRYFRRLRQAMALYLGEEPTLSVNGTVETSRIEVVAPYVDYLNGETWEFSPGSLHRMAERSRELGLPQIVSIFPDVPEEQYHAEEFVGRVRRTIALCYAMGMLPLVPWDVYAGSQPRWFGRWEDYREHYERVRGNPEWFEDYAWTDFEPEGEGAVVVSRRTDGEEGRLRHTVSADGTWKVEEI